MPLAVGCLVDVFVCVRVCLCLSVCVLRRPHGDPTNSGSVSWCQCFLVVVLYFLESYSLSGMSTQGAQAEYRARYELKNVWYFIAFLAQAQCISLVISSMVSSFPFSCPVSTDPLYRAGV